VRQARLSRPPAPVMVEKSQVSDEEVRLLSKDVAHE
jgi:hypothetical protein